MDLATQVEAEQAIDDLSGKEILQRRVSVQQARKNDGSQEKGENAVNGGETGSGGEGERRRFGGRGRGRGRGRPRGARGYRGSRNVSQLPWWCRWYLPPHAPTIRVRRC